MSLAVTPGKFSSDLNLHIFDFFWIKVWVAKTCSTSDVPIPWARRKHHGCCGLSPQTTVIPVMSNPVQANNSIPDAYQRPDNNGCQISGVFVQRLDLNTTFFIFDAFGVERRRHIMIRYSNGFVRRTTCDSCATLQRPEACDLMHKMAINIQKACLIFGFMGNMRVPYFIIKCLRGVIFILSRLGSIQFLRICI